jgi:uncharacterized protein (DUF1919 family)
MSEPFDIKKFFDLSPTALGKSLSIGWKVVLVGIVAFLIYRGLQPKQKQTQQITVESGGQATIIQKQTSKRFLIPFIEIYTMKEKDYSNFGYGLKAGLRVEF